MTKSEHTFVLTMFHLKCLGFFSKPKILIAGYDLKHGVLFGAIIQNILSGSYKRHRMIQET